MNDFIAINPIYSLSKLFDDKFTKVYNHRELDNKKEYFMDKWDERFMQMAETIAEWSSCYQENRHVGAICVKDKRILTTGYNGAPQGIMSCAERGECLRRVRNIASGTMQEVCYAVHAEQNAIIQAAKIGVSLEGAVMYVTHQPCILCTRMIINSGIKKVIYKNGYPDDFAVELFKQSGVELVKYSDMLEENK